MKRPNFEPIFTKKSEYSEKCVSKPVNTFVPGQAITIKELVTRFERGQRLNVHSNFAPGSNMQAITDEQAMARIKSEDMDSDDFPPTGVHDIADVEAHYIEHNQRKSDFSARLKKKAEETKQAQQKKQAQQDTPPAKISKNPDGTNSENPS